MDGILGSRQRCGQFEVPDRLIAHTVTGFHRLGLRSLSAHGRPQKTLSPRIPLSNNLFMDIDLLAGPASAGVGLANPQLSQGRRRMLDLVNKLHSTG